MQVYYLDGFYIDEFHGKNIPENAVKITSEEYFMLLDGQSKGKKIMANSTGMPILVDPQPSPMHELQDGKWIISPEKMTAILTEFIERIDEHAATIYSQWTRFESEYRERKAVAEEYKAANYQGECSRYITDFAKRAGIDNKAATDLILVQAAGLEKLQVELANQRMRKYELKAPDLTFEQMQATYDDIIKQMDALMEAYKNG